MQITMISNQPGPSGSILQQGNTYTVPDAFGRQLITSGYADDVMTLSESAQERPVMGRMNPLTWVIEIIDPQTGLPLVASSGGSSALAKPQLKVCWLGNSLIANGAGVMGAHIQKLSNGRFVTIKNGGVPGLGSAGVLSAIATNIDATADVVIVMEGANDAVSTIGCTAHYNNMKAIGDYCIAQGKQLVVLASSPRDLNGTTTSKYTMKYPLVDWLVAYDLSAIYCDPWRAFRTVDGEWPAGYTTSNDYTHPAFLDIYIAAAARIHAAIEGAVAKQIPIIEPTCDAENVGYSSVSNIGSTFLTKGGALFAGGVGNWRLVNPANPTTTETDANVVLSTASAAPFRGNELVIDFSAGITANRAVSRRIITNASTYRPAATDTVMCCAVVRATNLVNCKVQVYNYAPNGGWSNKTLMTTRQLDFAREFFSTGFFVAGGTGSAQEYDIVVEITRINTGLPATGVVAISNCDMYNITKLNSSQWGV